jgi:hypothetical protein
LTMEPWAGSPASERIWHAHAPPASNHLIFTNMGKGVLWAWLGLWWDYALGLVRFGLHSLISIVARCLRFIGNTWSWGWIGLLLGYALGLIRLAARARWFSRRADATAVRLGTWRGGFRKLWAFGTYGRYFSSAKRHQTGVEPHFLCSGRILDDQREPFPTAWNPTSPATNKLFRDVFRGALSNSRRRTVSRPSEATVHWQRVHSIQEARRSKKEQQRDVPKGFAPFCSRLLLIAP